MCRFDHIYKAHKGVVLGRFDEADSPTLTERVRTHMHELADAIFLVCKARLASETAQVRAKLQTENNSLKERLLM